MRGKGEGVRGQQSEERWRLTERGRRGGEEEERRRGLSRDTRQVLHGRSEAIIEDTHTWNLNRPA